MIPNEFEYLRAGSVDEAISLLQAHEDAKILAGGHSLIPVMKLRLNAPAQLIDISRVPELRSIREEGNTIVIGACVTHQEIASSELIQSKLPILAEAANMIGDVQVRNMGTIGGSLAHADPAADWPASMLATEAEIIVKGPNGERSIAASDFFVGLFTTMLEPLEILTGIRIPMPATHSKSTYVKFVQPASRFAIVGCAVVLEKNNGHIDNIKVAFTGVSTKAFRDVNVENALKGKSLDATNIAVAAEQAAEGVDVLGDHFASNEYRKHLAKVYLKRALNSL
ncbi:MAG: glyceraldehyde dehydrogenase subunit beta [Microscillaceae bacterium]|nr:glyceraldehyde dehydrogenase subunit beta [Microscillaceae bacterium]